MPCYTIQHLNITAENTDLAVLFALNSKCSPDWAYQLTLNSGMISGTPLIILLLKQAMQGLGTIL
jgi:hypothetical protein